MRRSKPAPPRPRSTTAREAATLLLGLPWELLHDGDGYLFQGAKPTRVRRRLPNTRVLDVPVVATPIRILLVTARPEDDACGYIDHRASALPLVEAMEDARRPGAASTSSARPRCRPCARSSTAPAREREPYHVVHFDGHGVYDRTRRPRRAVLRGPAGHRQARPAPARHRLHQRTRPAAARSPHPARLPRSLPDRAGREGVRVRRLRAAEGRRGLGRGHEPQRAGRDRAPLRRGVLRRAGPRRSAWAMPCSQASASSRTTPSAAASSARASCGWRIGSCPCSSRKRTTRSSSAPRPRSRRRRTCKTALAARLGELPPEPETGFIGRSRELLALQRLLRHERYAVVRGQGGEGKTALAAEFARWMVRSQQMRRAAFVSVETHSNAAAVLDAIGRQLVRRITPSPRSTIWKRPSCPSSARCRAVHAAGGGQHGEHPPAALSCETPEALSEEARRELDAILAALRAAACEGRHAARLHQPRGAARAVRCRAAPARAAPARPRGRGEAGRARAERRRRRTPAPPPMPRARRSSSSWMPSTATPARWRCWPRRCAAAASRRPANRSSS